jgi:hypothetical protein
MRLARQADAARATVYPTELWAALAKVPINLYEVHMFSEAEQHRTATALRRSAIAVAVSLAMASGAVYAQSTTVSTIFGQVTGQSAGAQQVLVENTATGLKRTVQIDSSGNFRAASLPPGHYKASLLKDGKAVSTVELDLLAGQGTEAVFASAANKLETVQVTGKIRTIDVTRSENGSTFTSQQLSALPIASQDLNGIIALSANTTAADPRYAGGVSIGGGAPSENAYYINGFPVTNALTQLGSIELPFGAIAQADIKTGGFGAEFGRSVGGVVDIITKSGTNEWHGGVTASVRPEYFRSKPKSTYYENTGAHTDTDGTIYLDRSHNTTTEYSYGLNIGGPLIKDKLFLFVAADQKTINRGYVNSTPKGSGINSTGWVNSTDDNTRYLTKVDWNISDDHQLEFTLLGDNYKTTQDFYGYSYSSGARTSYSYTHDSKNLANVTPGVGGDAQILKYKGIISPDLTVSALYGESSSKHKDSYNVAASPTFGWSTTSALNPNLTYVDPSKANPVSVGTTILGDGAKENTKSLRLDAEYVLKNHTIRGGLDYNKLKSVNAGEKALGGSYWQYYSTTNANYVGYGSIPISSLTNAVNGLYYYARQTIFDTVTDAQSNQSAQYIEDKHKVTNDLLLTYGLRNESFTNKNGDGVTFLESKNFLSPRLAAAYDVNGDASLKLYGSAGRYSLQIPTHVAVRGASRSTYTREYFAYTGIDQVTGLPTGTSSTGPAFSTNNEYGQAKDIPTLSAQNIKPTFQDEITLGIEKALSPVYTAGVKLTYRQLKQTIDDLCDSRPFENYAAANGINIDNWAGFGCASFNPGKDNTFLVDFAGTGKYQSITLSAKDLGFDKAKRTYLALDFSLEHRLRDNWYGKVTYTYSKSKGNTEGQTKSDNAQTDVAATSTWDMPELMEGAYGYLPNDRTHQIKAYGYYDLSPEWRMGANIKAESGRPKNCFGNYGGTGDAGYGSVYFYCNGQYAPRGSQGRLPWNFGIDLNAMYKPAQVAGLSLRVDVFNVFNKITPLVIDETRETANDYTYVPLATYGRVISYSAPRSVRFTAEYNF